MDDGNREGIDAFSQLKAYYVKALQLKMNCAPV